ncbi:hypothetical protein E2C01_006963 [Portunus trituberculatus]|uniref:Uncharacterized protein n=1 Tax=Portunus trituberculatus TaxID=210409 RepID=A0A5B7CZJ8_PORTR|nr:hypothetical protein [Portunus trituberculatus]
MQFPQLGIEAFNLLGPLLKPLKQCMGQHSDSKDPRSDRREEDHMTGGTGDPRKATVTSSEAHPPGHSHPS